MGFDLRVGKNESEARHVRVASVKLDYPVPVAVIGGDAIREGGYTFLGDSLAKLRPLNAYGWSKHVVDRRLARMVEDGAKLPPQWVGLKFFNVYGPNEYHKGSMRSVIARTSWRPPEWP